MASGLNRFGRQDDGTRFEWIEQRLERLKREGLYRELSTRHGVGATFLTHDRRPLVNFGSNDYLGLAGRVAKAADAACGSGASPLVTGFTSLHAQLCDELAEWEASESAVLFPSGFAACCGTVAALAQRGDLILSDALNHASLIDGCRLSKAERFRYPHLDAEAVHLLLKYHRHLYQRAWIVTDSVFSMDGDVAPLAELVEIAERWDAVLMVDEAHATGVLGETGSGACEAAGVKNQVPIRIGTLSKALGSQGGFAVGPKPVVEYLINHARTLIYSTAATPPSAAAALEAIGMVRQQPARRRRVVALARRVRERLRSIDRRILISDIPIVPLRLGEASSAISASLRLEREGFFVPAIRPPTVPPGTARLRISLSAAHTDQQVNDLLDAIERLTA